MKHHNTPFVILSAERADLFPETNAARTAALARQLAARKLSFKPVLGMYKGIEEHSFLVLVPGGDLSLAWDLCMSLAKHYGQETILFSDSARFTTLHPVHQTGGVVRLGMFKQVPKAEAESCEAYTRDGDQFYVAA